MKLFKTFIKDIQSIRTELMVIKGYVASIDASLELILGQRVTKEMPAPKKKGRVHKDYPQIGSLLHDSSITMKEFRQKAERNGWAGVEDVTYGTAVDREEAVAIIRKAQLRKNLADK